MHHWTRDVVVSPDGKRIFYSVGSGSNVALDMFQVPLDMPLETYSSRDIGALGFVDEDRVTFYRTPTRSAAAFDISRVQKLPRVDIVYTYAGADGALVDAAITQAKADGLVIAGFPTGSGTPAMDEAVNRLVAKGIPVVMTNRGGMGRVIDTRAAEKRPLLWGDNLTPQKARVLLMLALTRARDPTELQRIFQTY